MGDIAVDLVGAVIEERIGRVDHGPPGIDDVVDQDAGIALDFTDHVHDLGFARPLAALVDDRKGGIDAFGKPAGAANAPHVGRNHHHLGDLKVLLDVAHHHGRGIEVVGRDIEEALNLSGVEIESHHPVGARAGDEVGNELGRDRRARPRFAILAGIAEIRDHGRHATPRRAAKRIDDDEQLHQMVVGGIRRGLQDENIAAAHVLLDLDENLHVRKAANHSLGERGCKVGGDGVGQRGIGVAGHELDGPIIWPHRGLPSALRALIQAVGAAGNMRLWSSALAQRASAMALICRP